MSNTIRHLTVIFNIDIGNKAGGAERFGLELCRQLDAGVFAKSLCVFWQTGSATEEKHIKLLESEGISCFFATTRADAMNSADFFKGIASLVARQKQRAFDVIHAHHEGGALAGLLMRRFDRRQNRPGIVLRTAHSPLPNEWGIGPVHAFLRLAVSGILFPAWLDAEIPVADWYASLLNQRLVSRALKRPVTVIPNACSLVLVPVRNRANITPPIIGSVGRLMPQKQYHVLIAAMPRILAAFPEAQCELVGEGDLRASLEIQAQQLGVQQHVKFLGQCDDAIEIMQRWNAFVSPSLFEGIPTVMLEAMAGGVPVIASNIPGSSDLIKDGQSGWLTEPGNLDALADAVIDALENPDRAEAYARAAQIILPRFSIQTVAKQYEALYQQLLVRRNVRN